MKVYKITVVCDRPVKLYTGQTRIDQDRPTHYIAAYCYEQARQHVQRNLEAAGWNVSAISGETITVYDIRDTCDHTTDD